MSTGSRLTRREVFPFDTTEGEALRKIFENIPIDLEQLDDVVLDNVQDGEILQYNSSILSWENVPLPPQSVQNLDDIGDVVITSVSDGEVLTYDSGTGNWINATPTGGSGSPAGSNTEVQFNNSGSFGADAEFTYDSSSNVLTVGNGYQMVNTGIGTHIFEPTAEGGAGRNASRVITSYTPNGSFSSIDLIARDGSLAEDNEVRLTASSDTGNLVSQLVVNSSVAYPTYLSTNFYLTPVKIYTEFSPPTLGELDDVTITTPSNGHVLTYDSGSGEWVNAAPSGGGASDLDDLTDVTISTPVDGQVLTYDSGTNQWVNENLPAGVTTLDGLSDVTITSVADGQVLTYDSGTGQWVNETPTGGGGLTHFTESVNTSAPNATVPVVRLLATNAATNVDFVASTKGTGAFLARIPTASSAGGNKRGSNAFDMQVSRNNAAQVASGNFSVLVGGERNTVSGIAAFCGSGQDNTVSGTVSVVGGGSSNNASASNSFIGGGSNNTSSGGHSTIPGGQANQASGDFSWIPGGRGASTRSIVGVYAFSGNFRSSIGDNQCIGFTAQRTTTDATPTLLTGDRANPVSGNCFVLPNNSCWTGTVHITGRSSGGDVYYLRLDVVGARGANAAATTVKATNPAYTFTDTALVGVSAAVVANTTRGSLEVEVTGLAATTIDWFAHFDAGNQIVR